jgi:hypothetical protein
MKNIIIRDEKGRDIVKINDQGRIAIARFPDMSLTAKEYLLNLYKDVTKEDPEKLKNFLDYKTEENEFCV